MFNKPFSIGVYSYFRGGRSVAELHSYKYTCNKKLNKIIDRLPSYIKFAKLFEVEDRVYEAIRDKDEQERYKVKADYKGRDLVA